MLSTTPREREVTHQRLRRRTATLSWLMLLVMVLAACAGSSTDSAADQSEGMVDSGSWYVRVPWPHDGHPHESEHFVIYSDAASLESRVDVADRGERLWTEILSEMGVGDALRALPPGQEKVDIYAFENRSPEWAGKAYYGGLVISSPDRRTLFGLARTDQAQYESTLKHELIHVLTLSLLHGDGLAEPPWVPVWFFEGLAEALSTGTTGGSIRGLDHFDYLTSEYGHLNPVSYKRDDSVVGGVDAYMQYHYPMRQLAVEYLLDDNGFGRSSADTGALLIDMAKGSDFASAFQDRMGIAVADYEDQFFNLMRAYLPDRSASRAFAPLGLLTLSIVTVGMALAAAIRSARVRSPAALGKATDAVEDKLWTRLGRIGFGVWIAAVSALSGGVYLIGVYAIGSSWAFGEMAKAVGIGVMICYLAVATGGLTWAIRTRRNRSLIAWLIPIGVIGAAPATAAATVIILGVVPAT